jgi:hypothetical protein|tara:strand:+ start:927 stop:1034 length:108 start_codon:yes stop_codon:yes gene_type:complete
MAFQSKKQRTYLRIRKPKLYKKWRKKYGKIIRKGK